LAQPRYGAAAVMARRQQPTQAGPLGAGLGLVFLCCLLAGCGGKPSVPPGTVVAASAASPEIRLSKDSRCFEIAKLEAPALMHLSQANWTPDEWASLFRVQVILAATVTEDCANYSLGPALTGRYSVQDDVLRFEPQFVPVPGVDYLVKFKAERLP